MSLQETLRAKMTDARKAGRHDDLSILQVVLGDVATAGARSDKPLTDDEVEKIVRKIMTSNAQTLELLGQRGLAGTKDHAKLTAENVLLEGLVPKMLTVAEIQGHLAEVADALKTAKNEGQATGVAMKHLKSKNLKVLGDDVKAAVSAMRV